MKILRKIMAAALLSVPLISMAVPADRTPREYTQPDGSVVTLRQMGDEFYHFFLTEDGKMVLSNGSGYYFAEPSQTGRPAASSVLASNVANRSASDAQFVAALDRDKMLKEASAIASSKRNVRMQQRQSHANPYRAAAAASTNWPKGIGLFPSSSYPVTGSPKALIILVQFKDTQFTMGADYFKALASEKGFSQYNAHGSALDYFTAASNGQFTPQFDVLGPVTLPNNMAYYGGNDAFGDDERPAEMIRDAVLALDDTTDFSVYDTNGDGAIDNIYCIYSGLGEAAGGAPETIWPHSWDLREANISCRVDGKLVTSYACSAEYLSKGLPDGIGTFCHEFSHVLGLPDLYTVDYNSFRTLTPGEYSLMDQGSYNNNSRTPPTYSVFERNAMGWCDIEELKAGEARQIEIEHILTSNKGYVVATPLENEFFLLENRQKSDWDAYIPGHGMLIWHINYLNDIWDRNEVNNYSQQCVDIKEAGGRADNYSDMVMAEYPFPGTTNNTSFTSSTTPAFQSWRSVAIDAPLTNIRENDGKIYLDVCGGVFLEAPTCNITESIIDSEEPVEVILTAPESLEEGDQVRYSIRYNDNSEMVENEYTEPITIDKSCRFTYWTQRGDYTSKVNAVRIYIGEEAPADAVTYSIVFKQNSSDSNTTLNTNDKYLNQVAEGADIATIDVNGTSRVYGGKYGLKFGSSKENGTLTLDLTGKQSKNITKVTINARNYSSDKASISFNNLEADNLSAVPADYVYYLDGSQLDKIVISSTKRAYISSITFEAEGTGEPTNPEDPKDQDSYTITFGDESQEGTAVDANNFAAFCLEGHQIATFNEATRVYLGSTGLKFGSNKGSGTLTLDLNPAYIKEYTGITVSAKQYGSDAAAISVNGAQVIDLTDSFKNYTFPLNTRSILEQLTISGEKRFYVKSISFNFDKNTGIEGVATDEAAAEYFTLQGLKVRTPQPGNIYIRRQGGKVSKVLFR